MPPTPSAYQAIRLILTQTAPIDTDIDGLLTQLEQDIRADERRANLRRNAKTRRQIHPNWQNEPGPRIGG